MLRSFPDENVQKITKQKYVDENENIKIKIETKKMQPKIMTASLKSAIVLLPVFSR